MEKYLDEDERMMTPYPPDIAKDIDNELKKLLSKNGLNQNAGKQRINRSKRINKSRRKTKKNKTIKRKYRNRTKHRK